MNEEKLIDNMAMLIRRMARRLSYHKDNPWDIDLAKKAVDFLSKHDLHGSILRDGLESEGK